MHDRLIAHWSRSDVVPVEADVDLAEWNQHLGKGLDQGLEPPREEGPTRVDADEGQPLGAAVLLEDLVCDTHERAVHVVPIENRVFAHWAEVGLRPLRRITTVPLPGLAGPG